MIEALHVAKKYEGGTIAVNNISFQVNKGETLCLIGTSGCGKTTTLKMINRLIEPTAGEIQIDGQNILTRDPIQLRRGIGYIIQKGGLFPHMTVAENIGLLPRLEKWPESEIKIKVEELLNKVNLPPAEYMYRYPGELSGGQQQRVGVARALALDPPIILMDEPFGALDPITREQIQNEFLALKESLNVTSVMVTHDLPEAFKLGDRIALMDHGEIMQAGSMMELVNAPANEFVADFLKSHTGLEQLADVPAKKLMRTDIPVFLRDSYSAESVPNGYPLDTVFLHNASGEVNGCISRTVSSEEIIELDITLLENATLKQALHAFLETGLSVLPVVSTEKRMIGVLEKHELQKLL